MFAFDFKLRIRLRSRNIVFKAVRITLNQYKYFVDTLSVQLLTVLHAS